MRSLQIVLLLAFLITAGTAARGQTFETLFVDHRGQYPAAELVRGTDGNFYGTTIEGGTSIWGTIFKMTPEGAVTTLVSFKNNNGRYPRGRLVQGRDGNFYGTTAEGGAAYVGRGSVFKITPAGEFSTLVTFTGTNGGRPRAGLLEGPDGNFYGTTYEGGVNNYGTIFKMTPTGELSTLVSFNGTNGYYPQADLLKGSDGNFYGTTSQGGAANGSGTIFRMTPEGDLATLVTFDGPNGRYPLARLVEGSDGNFYGTTERGGSNDDGTIFKMTPSGELTTLVAFNGPNGRYPRVPLVKGSDGNFYGTTGSGGAFAGGTVFKMTPAGGLTTLVSCSRPQGGNPSAGLLEGSEGTFYVTTSGGGAGDDGAIFKLTSAGVFTRVYSFNSAHGRKPSAGLVRGSDGNFYGTSTEGGAFGNGTVFKVSPAGEIAAIASFYERNGTYPRAELTEGIDGNFYGTTSQGGAYGGLNRHGTIFKVTPAGDFTSLVSFDGTNGSNPYAALVKGTDGNFYGTTFRGGASGLGTMFKVSPTGTLATLVSFNRTNGSNPKARVVVGNDGNFYGTTYGGGAYDKGTIFKVTPAGEIATLVSFNGINGSDPSAELLKGSDGNFYGTTEAGGTNTRGTIFKVTPAGELTTLSSFIGVTHAGRHPYGGLVEGSDGNFYGTTSLGGASDQGTIFRITPAGVLTTLHSFDGVVADRPETTPIFDSERNLYGVLGQMVVWRLSVPMAPRVIVTSPRVITNTRATLSGTVNANGAASTATFEYGPTPDYGSSVVASPATVTGASETTVTASISGLFPQTTYYYRITASNVNGAASSTTGSFTTAANRGPVASNDSFARAWSVMTLPVLGNDSDPDGDPLAIAAVTQGSYGVVSTDGNTLTYIPGSGFRGHDSFSYTVSDGFDTATAQVELHGPFMRVLLSQGSEVPGAGQEGSGIPAGSLFKSFGVPSINSGGKVAFTASYGAPGSAGEVSVFGFEPETVTNTLIARRGQSAPGTEGALFSSFKDPLLNEAGDIALLASLASGDTTPKSKEGIWISSLSEVSGLGLELIARTGAQPPGVPEGARWKSFTSVALASAGTGTDLRANRDGWSLAFTGFMSTGAGGVKASNDMGLWLAGPDGTVLALREGQKFYIGEKETQLRTFAALKALPAAPGQGNGATSAGVVAVQVFFTDGSQALLRVSRVSPGDDINVETLALPGNTLADIREVAAKFGVPAQSRSGAVTAWVGSLSGKGSSAAIFQYNRSEFELPGSMARKGGAAYGIDGASFNVFKSVAVSDSGSTLFRATVSGKRISKAGDEAIWWRQGPGDTEQYQLLAREGMQPPGVPEGARWSAFTSMALPDGPYGPLFTARIVGSKANGERGWGSNASDQGLWAVDSEGELRLIVHEGQEVHVEGQATPKTLKSFTVLSAVPGSPAQRRSFDDDGQIVYRAVFTDGSQAVVKVQVP